MTAIERTAYTRFGRLVTARKLAALSPASDEVAWARDRARSDAHLLAGETSLEDDAKPRHREARTNRKYGPERGPGARLRRWTVGGLLIGNCSGCGLM